MEYMSKEEVINSSEQIIKWYYKSKNKVLSILTVPFNTTLIFSDLLLEAAKKSEKILYVWGERFEDSNLKEYIETKNKNIRFAYEKSDINMWDINYIHYDSIQKIDQKYNIAIFDDISYFSNLDRSDIKEIVDNLRKISEKVIVYTVESIIKFGEQMEAIPLHYKYPFVEPRVLNTRIDLNKDIPSILYEYLIWFAENKRKIIIFVPDEERLNSVYQYYTKKLRMKRIKIVPLLKNEDKVIIRNVLRNTNEATIIITNSMEERLINSHIGNAIVLFADDETYKYKKLLYLCAEMGRIDDYLPEMLLVSKETTEDIDKVKYIMREFNKKKWENSLKL